MNKLTLLNKNNRIRIKENNRLKNLINHLIRNYKPGTKQYKSDFLPEFTKNNLVIDSDFNFEAVGEDWQDSTQSNALLILDDINNELNLADSEELKRRDKSGQTLDRKEKDKILKSISYLSKLESSSNEKEFIQPVIDVMKTVRSQEASNKDYSIIDKVEIESALNFYKNIDKNNKVKSLSAKKKHLKNIIDNIDGMSVINNQLASEIPNSIMLEEQLFKIPKHNGQGIKDEHAIEIMVEWHKKHFKNYKLIKGYLHKDERTNENNEVDDHIHFLRSGRNSKTNKFDINEHQHKIGLEFAEKNGFKNRAGIKIDISKIKNLEYSKTTEEVRSIAGEAFQKDFYNHANRILKKYNYEFRFEKKELSNEEILLRKQIKKMADLPKSQRGFSMMKYFMERAEENAKGALNAKNEYTKEKNKAKDLISKKDKMLKIWKKKAIEEGNEELDIAINSARDLVLKEEKEAANKINAYNEIKEFADPLQAKLNEARKLKVHNDNSEILWKEAKAKAETDKQIAKEERVRAEEHTALNDQRELWFEEAVQDRPSPTTMTELVLKIVELFSRVFKNNFDKGEEWLERTKTFEKKLFPDGFSGGSITDEVRQRRRNNLKHR